jgi:hypothetical protein
MRGISSLSEQLTDSQEVFCCTEMVFGLFIFKWKAEKFLNGILANSPRIKPLLTSLKVKLTLIFYFHSQ